MIDKKILINEYEFLDNEYLNMYLNLIFKNMLTKKIKFKTQKHHVIPVSYYKDKYNKKTRKDVKEFVENDPNNFTVNLLYKDHILAHYYLSLCTSGKLKYQNESAIFHVIGNNNYLKDENYLEEITDIHKLEKWQELYEDMASTRSKLYTGRHCKPNTEAHKKAISEKNSGNVYVRKLIDGKYIVKKARSKEEYDNYIAQGFERGNYPRTKAMGNAISVGKKGKICIVKNNTNKYINKEDLPKFEAEGWKKGRAKEHIRERIHIKKLDRKLYIYKEELNDYLGKGWMIDNEN